MAVYASVLVGSSNGNTSIIAVLAAVSASVAWLLATHLNSYEHSREIRSSTTIFAFYTVSIATAAIVLRTTLDLGLAGSNCLIAFITFLATGFLVEAWPRGATAVQQRSGACEFDKANPLINLSMQRTLVHTDVDNMQPADYKTLLVVDRMEHLWKDAVQEAKARGRTPSLFWTILRTFQHQLVPIVMFRVILAVVTYGQPYLLGLLLDYLGGGGTEDKATADPRTRTREYGIRMAQVAEALTEEKLRRIDARTTASTQVLSGIKVVKLYGWEQAFLERIQNHLRKAELDTLAAIGRVQAITSIIFISSSLIICMVTLSVYALIGGPDFTPGQLTPKIAFVSMALFSLLRNPVANLSDALSTTIAVLVSTRRLRDYFLLEEVDLTEIVRRNLAPGEVVENTITMQAASFAWIPKPSAAATPLSLQEDNESDERQPLISPTRVPAPSALYRSISRDHPPTARQAKATLENINLEIPFGKLTAIVGRVGQGKSSLLSAMIGEMYKWQGTVVRYGSIAYVPQQAWIYNASVRDNILFGQPFVKERYCHILAVCGLEPDLAILPAGDQTEIGERGINLSGGQRQRVSLARAAYADADVYLMDDPLSAVDAHVDRHLWDELIGPNGLLRHKTRVLVTHGIQHLKHVDQVVVVTDGRITEKGHYQDLMAAQKSFYRLIKEYSVQYRRERRRTMPRRRSTTTSIPHVRSNLVRAKSDSNFNKPDSSIENVENGQEDDTQGESESIDTESSSTTTGENQTIEEHAEANDRAKLVSEEEMAVGEVTWRTVSKYLRAASYRYCAIVLVLFAGGQLCLVGSNLWLKYWIKVTDEAERQRKTPPSIAIFLVVYAVVTILYVLAYMAVMWVALAVARIRASAKIHKDLLNRVLRLPMSFFDTTPLGRILNRFSSDIVVIDGRIPLKIVDTLYFFFIVSSTLIIVTVTTPLFALILPFLIYAYWRLMVKYLCISNPAMRIYSISKSPVYQHFTETIHGMSTIRTMEKQSTYINQNLEKTDFLGSAFLPYMFSKRWLEIQIRLLSTVVVFSASISAVLFRGRADPSTVGLTLGFAMTISEEVTSLVRIYSDLQNQFISVERVQEYSDLNTEAPEHTDVHLPDTWPTHGEIAFRNYSTRYREGTDLVLRDVSFTVRGGEKVGIVGRTGAGKSSLTLALYRIIEAANSYWARASYNGPLPSRNGPPTAAELVDGGRIEIDGLDISTLGLYDLRQHLAIIPQDPILFAGTLRENLDPFGESSDADLWIALERAHLKSHIQTLPGGSGLSFEVSANGDNFSVGQRSLLCLARALLRKTKILVLDEATSSVDMQTDELIQQTIRTEFQDRTILTIAHRIKTVMDYDKILVLDHGRVQEFASPQQLIRDSESMFYKLAEQAGEI
ncbi:Canalicular multispecific organic anion transporter 2 [Actinomortierella ambigua]|uniref:Canalicular multispecific organic anion transporter 2 n=1 Tax=Actinomortierella ambigua TaxID=1343610 RepID=A0A9P6U4K3_9FUNG|nr:Canalicular multispecific organic anion transporter 2 [Actinomortierella ambigua]